MRVNKMVSRIVDENNKRKRNKYRNKGGKVHQHDCAGAAMVAHATIDEDVEINNNLMEIFKDH